MIFRFPVRKDILKIWIERLDLSYNFTVSQENKIRICSKHFAASDINVRSLKSEAVPQIDIQENINFPHFNEEEFQQCSSEQETVVSSKGKPNRYLPTIPIKFIIPSDNVEDKIRIHSYEKVSLPLFIGKNFIKILDLNWMILNTSRFLIITW